MSIINALRIVAKIMPIITEVVNSVEAVHGDKSGDAKRKLAIDVVGTLYNHTDPVVSYEDIKAQVGSTVDTLVQTYNEAGDFVTTVKAIAA